MYYLFVYVTVANGMLEILNEKNNILILLFIIFPNSSLRSGFHDFFSKEAGILTCGSADNSNNHPSSKDYLKRKLQVA